MINGISEQLFVLRLFVHVCSVIVHWYWIVVCICSCCICFCQMQSKVSFPSNYLTIWSNSEGIKMSEGYFLHSVLLWCLVWSITWVTIWTLYEKHQSIQAVKEWGNFNRSLFFYLSWYECTQLVIVIYTFDGIGLQN